MAAEPFAVEDQDLPQAREGRQHRRAIGTARAARAPDFLAGRAVIGQQRPPVCRLGLGARIDNDHVIVDERRPAHAPLQVRVIVKDVALPPQRARDSIEADQLALSPTNNRAAGNGGRHARPRASQRLLELGGVAVGPDLLAGDRVVADDGLLIAPLFQGHGRMAHHSEAGIAAAHGLPPHLSRWRRLPVADQGGAVDDAVALSAAIFGEVERGVARQVARRPAGGRFVPAVRSRTSSAVGLQRKKNRGTMSPVKRTSRTAATAKIPSSSGMLETTASRTYQRQPENSNAQLPSRMTVSGAAIHRTPNTRLARSHSFGQVQIAAQVVAPAATISHGSQKRKNERVRLGAAA